MPATPDPKPCVVCGRAITWRKKWERDWANVKYCSVRCRRAGVKNIDARLDAAMIALLTKRGPGASICPSEVARAIESDEAAWRTLLEPARMSARRLVARGLAEITQGGRVVDPSRARGPIRVRGCRSLFDIDRT